MPFRLTRMLINAMEVSGFEGNFRITCQSVMHLLREHKQSVMAVLEALAYDPLMNWRLLEQEEQEKEKEKEKEEKKKEQKQQKQTDKENGLKLDDVANNTGSSSASASSSINQSPLSINGTPTSIADSTTNFTPELNLSNGNTVL